ncbi:MAG: branched-chain amino acid transport [Rhizobiales bacterium 65-79]|nr:AzlD family protein [Hyphomicrobiales bacterium]OJU06768.1 MAG: branched-chain amino acid transport [Rhizobiales bacterium 65-79]
MSTTAWVILAGAVLTYLTRIGGHLALSRFKRVPPRLEAALDAVPAAVLTTLVAPDVLFAAGPAEWSAIVVAGLVALKRGLLAMFISGAVVLIVLRQFVG